jgi:hypothetical protein
MDPLFQFIHWGMTQTQGSLNLIEFYPIVLHLNLNATPSESNDPCWVAHPTYLNAENVTHAITKAFHALLPLIHGRQVGGLL